jgi:hypothetical protein
MSKVSQKIIRLGEVLDVVGASQPGTLKIRAREISKVKPDLDKLDFKKWSAQDPFVFVSLLPIFFNQAPKVGENVLLIYANPDDDSFDDQYWIQASPSNILNINYEDYLQTLSNTGMGDNIAKGRTLVGPASNVLGSPLDVGNPKLINQSMECVFPESDEIAVMGRGTSDIIIGDNNLLIRVGKVKSLTPNRIPEKNPYRSFIDLSRFTSKTITYPLPYQYFYLQNTPLPVRKYLEYDIDNLESDSSNGGTFSGEIRIYDLKQSDKTLSTNINENTILNDVVGNAPIFQHAFQGVPIEQVAILFNKILNSATSFGGLISIPPSVNYVMRDPRYPLYFRYGPNISEALNERGIRRDNAVLFKNSVIYMGLIGNGVIYGPNDVVKLPVPKSEVVFKKQTLPTEDTYLTLGSRTLYLLSHDTNIESKGFVDISDGVCKLSQKKLEDIVSKTDPMVRGDELMKLISLIVSFLVSHVHNPNEGPDAGPYGANKVTIQTILTALENANNTILNQNIRIN